MVRRMEASLEIEENFFHLIDGTLEVSKSSFPVINPSTESVFAKCPDASREQLDSAVVAARRSFSGWGKRSYEERATMLRGFGGAIIEHTESLAEVLTREQGKPLAQAKLEIQRAAAQYDRITQIEVPSEVLVDDDKQRTELRYRPLGVVGAITPWNVPVLLACGKIVQALYTGNTMVLKPSPYTPLSTLMLGELAAKIFPPGVLNILAGGDNFGRWMTEHPDIDKISFTGSVAAGKKVMASAAARLKRITLELGGNDAAIVLEDVDPEKVAPELFAAAFVNSGQICAAIKRVYVHESLYEEVSEKIAEEARKVKFGDGFDPSSNYGPVNNKMQFEKLVDLIEDTKRSGAKILTGGDVPDRKGYYINPTVVVDIDDDARLVKEEQFGPVLPILKFSDPEDAIRRANGTRFGLSGSVWTNDLEKGEEIAARLEVGTAWVNQHLGISPDIPFGGAKESGLGREYSIVGLKGYMEPEVIHINKKARI